MISALVDSDRAFQRSKIILQERIELDLVRYSRVEHLDGIADPIGILKDIKTKISGLRKISPLRNSWIIYETALGNIKKALMSNLT